jgi:hypothetical protein
VTVAGARLDGAPDGPACALVTRSDLDVTLRVKNVHLQVTDAAKNPVDVLQDDEHGCPTSLVGFCQGGVLSPAGEACVAGVGFGPLIPAGTYDVTVGLTLTTRCTSGQSWPCDQTGKPVPTSAQPVDVTVLASGSTQLEWPGAGGSPP